MGVPGCFGGALGRLVRTFGALGDPPENDLRQNALTSQRSATKTVKGALWLRLGSVYGSHFDDFLGCFLERDIFSDNAPRLHGSFVFRVRGLHNPPISDHFSALCSTPCPNALQGLTSAVMHGASSSKVRFLEGPHGSNGHPSDPKKCHWGAKITNNDAPVGLSWSRLVLLSLHTAPKVPFFVDLYVFGVLFSSPRGFFVSIFGLSFLGSLSLGGRAGQIIK